MKSRRMGPLDQVLAASREGATTASTWSPRLSLAMLARKALRVVPSFTMSGSAWEPPGWCSGEPVKWSMA
jgi:hypothetical protein